MSAIVNVKIDSVVPVDIDCEEAFRVLCKSLQMGFVLDENTKFVVRKNRFGDNGVYCVTNGQERLYDSRGDLFVALRNVAVQLFPNVEFGNEPYIYNGNFKCFEGDNYESKVID